MIVNKQSHFKITYLLLIILLLCISLILTACADDTSSDNDIQISISDKDSKQIKKYSETILKRLYQAFPPKTKDSAKYQKTKSNKYRIHLLETALKQGDLGSLVAICHDNPTNLNKAYVFACGISVKYDKANIEKYTVCLVYHYNLLTTKDKKQAPPILKKFVNKCITIIYNSNQDMENELLFDEQQQMLLRRMED